LQNRDGMLNVEKKWQGKGEQRPEKLIFRVPRFINIGSIGSFDSFLPMLKL
jgi:hypothetical protein